MKLSRLVRIRGKRVNRSWAVDGLLFLILGGMGAFMAVPLVFVINNAFKPLDEIFIFPPRLFVQHPTLDNFRSLFTLMGNSWVPFSRYLFNSFFIALAGTAGHVLLASAAAYPLAKHRFPGNKIVFRLIVLSLMFVGPATMFANYMIMSWLHFLDSYWAVIVPAFGASLGLYLMKQFMEQIPDAYLEAAKMDGGSEYYIFWRIVMPLVKPAWLTLIIFSFQGLWGSSGGNYIFSEELKTMDYAFSQIQAGGIVRTGPVAAVGLLMMSLPITVFLITQSNIIQTMSSSGMKE